MATKTAWNQANFLFGIILTTLLTSSVSLGKIEPDCIASDGQSVVKWKDMYWFPCKYSLNGICLWPIQRRHSTYKITVTEGSPVLDENGNAIPIANGKRKDWEIYDSVAWNAIENIPRQKNRYSNYEPIAANEYVVLVETRYKLFHDVEATLRICTQKI